MKFSLFSIMAKEILLESRDLSTVHLIVVGEHRIINEVSLDLVYEI